MKNIIKILLCYSSIALSVSIESNGQSYIGFNTSNYAGVIGATIHPASIENYPSKFDVIFLGTNTFLDNNVVKISRDHAFLNFKLKEFSDSFSHDRRLKHLMLDARVMLPSFMIKTKNWGTLGMINRVRNNFFIDNISPDLLLEVDNLNKGNELGNEKYLNQHFQATAMSWGEVGFTWAKAIKKDKHEKITLGITPKLLFGAASGFANFQADTTSISSLLNDDLVYLTNIDASFGYSNNFDSLGAEDSTWMLGNKLNFGMDLGIEYTVYHKTGDHPTFSKPSNQHLFSQKRYKYKISASLLDLGRIKYNYSENSGKSITIDPFADIDSTKVNLNDIEALLDTLDISDFTEPLVGSYTVGLPTTLQMGVDYHLIGGAYLNANVQVSLSALKWADQTTRNITSITITPRWESNEFEAHLPIYANLEGTYNVGLGTRIGPVAFGISDVLPFISRKDVTSVGAYIIFKTYIQREKVKSHVIECPSGRSWNKKR